MSDLAEFSTQGGELVLDEAAGVQLPLGEACPDLIASGKLAGAVALIEGLKQIERQTTVHSHSITTLSHRPLHRSSKTYQEEMFKERFHVVEQNDGPPHIKAAGFVLNRRVFDR